MGGSMATKQAYVQVKGLKKHYGDGDARLTVLDGIDTSINRGEICVMLGPSGSGKSTFLNLIGGLEDADGGSIHGGRLRPHGAQRRPTWASIAAVSWALSSSSTTWCPISPSRKTSRSRRTCPKTRSMSTTCCVRWASTSTVTSSRARSRAASSSAAPSAVRSSKTRVCCCATSPPVRSTIRRPRKSCSSWKTSTATYGCTSHYRHPQRRHRAHGQSRAAPARRAHRRGRAQRVARRPPPSSIGRRRHDTSRKTSPARAAPQYRQVPGHLFTYVRKHRPHLGLFARGALHRLPYR